ncbi:hypothetical protein Y032_0056g2712 [Ancylostoma ceylanicum]|nr:hypothetical protein Y032_0056g2712 [Ancylostoma ceylanicum]
MMKAAVAVLLCLAGSAIGDRCSKPLIRGPCLSIRPRYGFDPKLGKCVRFFYGGCGGNGNNFETKEECQDVCESDDPGLMPPIDPGFFNEDTGGSFSGPTSNVCSLPVDRGNCRGRMTRYAFDAERGRCVPFIWGGCGGNANRFETQLSCRVSFYAIPNPCELPLAKGPCSAFIPRYGYDKAKGKCVQFAYGGCKGNKNNFLSIENCQQECMGEGILDRVSSLSKKYVEKKELTKEVKAAFDKAKTKEEKKQLKEAIQKNVAEAIKKTIVEEKIKRIVKDAAVKNKVEKAVEKLKELKEKKSNPCMMPIVQGKCRALIKRYAFDAKKGKCVKFSYGGCGGNENNFETMAECKKRCKANTPMPI